jgi:hypothetical protein
VFQERWLANKHSMPKLMPILEGAPKASTGASRRRKSSG